MLPDEQPDQLWGLEDAEEVNADQDELIGQYLDGCDGREYWPETLVVYEYRLQTVRRSSCVAWRLAEMLLEDINDDYGSPDPGDWQPPSPEDIADMAAAINAIVSRYRVWRCEPTGHTETVDVREWVRANMSEDDEAMAWANGGGNG